MLKDVKAERTMLTKLVMVTIVWLGVPVSGHADIWPPVGEAPSSEAVETSAERQQAPVVGPTLPSSASHGPARRGDWRVDSDAPQARVVWEHHVHVVAAPEPVRPEVRYLRYATHPHADGTTGYVLRGSVPAEQRLPGRLHAGQVALEGGYAARRRGRVGLSLRLAFWRLGFDANVTSHVSGRTHSEGPVRSVLVVGSNNGLFAPILRPRINWWVGGGMNYAALPPPPDASRARLLVGPNLTSSVDLFVVRPVVVSLRGDMGVLGGAPTMAGRGTVGFTLASFELYAGYEARRIADTLLQGPMIGARAWF